MQLDAYGLVCGSHTFKVIYIVHLNVFLMWTFKSRFKKYPLFFNMHSKFPKYNQLYCNNTYTISKYSN